VQGSGLSVESVGRRVKGLTRIGIDLEPRLYTKRAGPSKGKIPSTSSAPPSQPLYCPSVQPSKNRL